VFLIGCLAIFFINHNYNIFLDVALNSNPDLLQHLERERTWANISIVTAMIGCFVFCIVFGLRLTGRIITPLKILKHHLHISARGEFFQPDVHIRDTDEFQDLVEAYNYFYRSIQHQTQNDLHRLKTISTGTVEKQDVVKELMDEKIRQMRSS